MNNFDHLRQNALEGIKDLTQRAVAQGAISEGDLIAAVEAEVNAQPGPGSGLRLAEQSQLLLGQLSASDDADLLPVIRKVLKSTRLAALTHRGSAPEAYEDQPLFPS